ncbi:hypothetical protein VTJ49DRAFT_922 [Mycothermus thermophilus]|uniref:Large ribosomal subunit protein uL15/eL18 domain-containing protein n=1 Tax=Humicola insolens TaxID=85995 RepID=A0ABR3VDV3_HUMIN
MPPRLPIPLTQAARCCAAPASRPQAPSLVSLFAALSLQSRTPTPPTTATVTTPTQIRSASILANLSDNKGAYNKRIRKGRGPSSGYGKTAGRGHKGQKQHGKVKPWFQGGQTPLIVSHGRHGFINFRAPKMMEVNLEKLQKWIDTGRIDPKKQITPRELIRSNLVGNPILDGIKLLAGGKETFRTPINIVVSRASAAAIEAVERAGGKILTRYYTRDALKRLVRGEVVHTTTPLPVGPEHVNRVLGRMRHEARVSGGKKVYRLPDPTSREDIEYYRDPAHRGYLSHTLKPGESPSLFFKVPGAETAEVKAVEKERAEEQAARLF